MDKNELEEFRKKWLNDISSQKHPQEEVKSNKSDEQQNVGEKSEENSQSKSYFTLISNLSRNPTPYENKCIENSSKSNQRSLQSSSSKSSGEIDEPQDTISLLLNFPSHSKRIKDSQAKTSSVLRKKYFDDFNREEGFMQTDCKRKENVLTSSRVRKSLKSDHSSEEEAKYVSCSNKREFPNNSDFCNEGFVRCSENLIDQLISDIDEITSIPFFDIEIPREVAVKIFSQLALKDLGNCACVSKSWQNLAEDELIWYQLCINLGYETGAETALDRTGWKEYVKDCVIRDRNFKKNWRERICTTTDLEFERGGILCAAHLVNNLLITGYVTGDVRLWDVKEKRLVKSLETTHGDLQSKPMVTCASVSGGFCAAAFENGDVNVWCPQYQASPIHQYQCYGSVSHITMVNGAHPMVVSTSGEQLRIETTDSNGMWFTCENKSFSDKVDHVKPVPTMKSLDVSPLIVFTLKDSVRLLSPGCGSDIVLEQICGSKMTTIDCSLGLVVAGVAPYGYGIIGYKARLYCLQTHKLLHSFSGHTREITCINLAKSPQNFFVSGCRDKRIRIYDIRNNVPIMSFHGHSSAVTSVQMDEWKVASGSEDGSICVWDQRMASLLWETKARHPVHVCQFKDNILTTVHVPKDKNPKNTLWYADDLVQHRRHRGNIRICDFNTENLTLGVPDICLSTYDDRTGYNYNINLMVPYDDVNYR